MVFNWFRRRFNESPEASENEPIAELPVEPAETEAERQTSSRESPEGVSAEVADDYLSWAKLAYQNLQKQQASQPGNSTTSEENESPLEAGELPTIEMADAASSIATDEIEAAGTPAATEIPAPTEEVTTPELSEASLAMAGLTGEAAVASSTGDDPPGTGPREHPPGEAPTTALPFWARAEAERQERLERLKATAIEEPEAETTAQSTTQAAGQPQTLPSVPDLAFDEGFLWSAEILAAQGRQADQVSVEEITWLKRLRQGLDKTRRSLVNQLKAIVGQGPLNQAAILEIESLLLQADVGVEATDRIVGALQQKLREEVLPPEAAIAYLKEILREMLDNPLGQSYSPTFAPEKNTLNIWLMTGVNGAGKTTTIGKIAHLAKQSDYTCLIAAADTFRAAAVEQVRIWGQRSGIEVIANPGQNTDPAAVVYDAIAAAQARTTELLLVDTAGRLQNKKNLMDELSKIRRIVAKKAPEAKVESLLVLDATLGQNGLRQAQVFSEAAQLTGVVLTKLDGTAKGGVALAVVQQLALPIRFIGAGEGIQDLRPFSSYEFVEALLGS